MTGVRIERNGPIGSIILDRPTAGNAIDLDLARALLEAAIEVDEDDAVRCVLLTGEGRMFCAGGDINAFTQAGDRIGQLLKAITSQLHAAIATLFKMNKPLVTAINGPVAGAGLSLAILGDIVVAAPEASFTPAYGKVGLSPDGGATWLVPRLIGLRRAQELFLRNTKLTAHAAAQIGLITRVAEDGALQDEAMRIAAELVAGPISALGATRDLLLEGWGNSFEAHLEAERRSIARQGGHFEGREGIEAFAQKRGPRFQL
ncbi:MULTISPECIES: enoyl-CoA hydratase/isomerase family protein [unclassified Sphingomonas]|uniref:enoyl-CoA hydratase/isomerase family protein n=1 Tax=unclassified Sphingomonas TaxID=196159 RepID=UPI00083488AA|nr:MULTISPECIES: enoyl-CoA hydratase-related protein [unclassified Sphingomonas]